MFEPGIQYQCVVKTMAGFENILADELRSLRVKKVENGTRAVYFEGDLEDIYRVNYWSRYALRVLISFHEYKAFDDKRLHSKAMQFEWEKLISVDKTFAINSAVSSDYHQHSHFASLRVKDAIADYFMEKYDERPSVDLDEPDVRIHLHIEKQFVTLSIDSSGESLHKRGYRSAHFEAPLNEVLAAGMIKLSGWTPDQPFWDPMCGSGTLITEGLMMAKGIAPQVKREKFGFMGWGSFDEELFEKIKNEQNGESVKGEFYASDLSPESIIATYEHLSNLNLQEDVDCEAKDLMDAQPPSEKAGIAIINPPYGVRLEKDDVAQFYGEMSSHIKHNLKGWDVWIFTSNTDALKRFGLKPSKKIRLFNGALECRFHQYEIFAGRRSEHLSSKSGKEG